jgi:hypothetical protein
MKINWRYFILFFLLFAVLGYYREKFFVTLNHLMYIKYYGHGHEEHLDPFILFLDSFDYNSLYYMKYPLTILSIILFGCLSYFAVRFILGTKKLWRWVVYSYLILLTLAGISMLFGYIVNQSLQNDEYTLSRWLVGIIQSPIITILIIASHQLLAPKNQENKIENI